jgi:hypothetical protein
MTGDFGGGGGAWVRPPLIFFTILKHILYFLKNIFTGGFITLIANGNRFPLTIFLVQLPVKIDFQ